MARTMRMRAASGNVGAMGRRLSARRPNPKISRRVPMRRVCSNHMGDSGMAWNTPTTMDQRTRLILEHEQGTYSVAALARRYGVSRKTTYKWIERFDAESWAGLQDRSPSTPRRGRVTECVHRRCFPEGLLVPRCTLGYPLCPLPGTQSFLEGMTLLNARENTWAGEATPVRPFTRGRREPARPIERLFAPHPGQFSDGLVIDT